MIKIGAENQKKAIAAGALFFVALVLFIRLVAGPSSSSPSPAKTTADATDSSPTAHAARRISGGRKGVHTAADKNAVPLTPSLDPRLHLALLAESETTEYKGNGRNLFNAQVEEIPTAVAPAGKGAEVAEVPVGPQQPPPPPPPPPINLKFFGFTSASGVKKVFLSQGEDVFVALEGDIVQRRYKIVKINNTSIEVLDVLSNNRQTIPLTAG